MMISEFIERTGFEPTAAEYEQIEEAYYGFDGDKNEFCKMWKQNGGIEQAIRGRAKKIEQLQSQMGELEKDLMKQIKSLEAQLEWEQEWKPYTDEHNYKQTDYDHLAGCGRVMTDEEAIRWVCDEFGFREDKVKVHHEIDEFEINRHKQLRRTGKKLDRRPLYDATDWNYVRFDVGNWMYYGKEETQDHRRGKDADRKPHADAEERRAVLVPALRARPHGREARPQRHEPLCQRLHLRRLRHG